MNVILTVNRDKVYDEVAQTTSYTGAKKLDEDENAYDRIFTTDEDRSQLSRFWDETCVGACEMLKNFLASEGIDAAGNYTLELSVSASFDPTLRKSMEKELFSYFVTSITARWYTFTNKNEAPEYAAAAASLLEGVHRKACFKKKPTRPKFNH